MYLQLMHLAQASLAIWAGRQSYVAISKLHKYEAPAQKLAKWSSTAGRQLHSTRSTQAAGAAAIGLSALVALYLGLHGGGGGGGRRAVPRLLGSPAMLAAVLWARRHMAGYWAADGAGNRVGPKLPLPKMDAYNEAQRRTEAVLRALDWLALSWAATSIVAFLAG